MSSVPASATTWTGRSAGPGPPRRTVGDTPAELELERLATNTRELAGAGDHLYESRALRGG